MVLAKHKSLAIVPKLTGSLSLLGSLFVLQDILRDKKKRRKSVYHKLMIGLSFFDTISSVTNIFSTWPSPSDIQDSIYGASGTTATCTAQGFFNEFGNLTTSLYTASLCMRYLLVVRYNWRESKLKKFQALFHAVPITIGLTMGVLGLPLNLYNNSEWTCWYAPYPADCSADNSCTRGELAGIFRWIHYGFVWSAILFVTVAMMLIYAQVKAQELKAQFLKEQTASIHEETGESTTMRRISRRLSLTSLSTGGRGESSEQRHVRKRMTNTKKVADQALLYVGALYLTWIFTTLTRILQTTRNESYYALLLLMTIFFPLQGLFNAVIYARPRYLRRRGRKIPARRTTLEALRSVPVAGAYDDSEASGAFDCHDVHRIKTAVSYRLGVLEECKSEEGQVPELLDKNVTDQEHTTQLSSAAATVAISEDSRNNDNRTGENRSRSRGSFVSIGSDSSAASRGY